MKKNRNKKLKELAEQDLEEIEEKKEEENPVSEFAITPFGSKFKFKGGGTYLMLPRSRRGYFL